MAPAEALGLIAARPAEPFDLLRIETGDEVQWCANVASGGFGTQVTVETHDGLKDLLGGLAYLITGLSRLGRIDPVQARLHGPGFAWQGGFVALGVGNGRQAGGGQALCPDARIDDGLLDVTIIPELDGEIAGTLGALVTGGKRAALEHVAVRRRLPWLEIESDAAITLNLDGEPLQATRFRIDCVRHRLRLHSAGRVPAAQKRAVGLRLSAGRFVGNSADSGQGFGLKWWPCPLQTTPRSFSSARRWWRWWPRSRRPSRHHVLRKESRLDHCRAVPAAGR